MGPSYQERSETDPIAEEILKLLDDKYHINGASSGIVIDGQIRMFGQNDWNRAVEAFKQAVNDLIWVDSCNGF